MLHHERERRLDHRKRREGEGRIKCEGRRIFYESINFKLSCDDHVTTLNASSWRWMDDVENNFRGAN